MTEIPTARAGLVGGIGPESTIDYYRRILDGWGQHRPGTAPSIIIDSIDVQRALRLVASDRAAFTDYLAASLGRLEAAGATFIAMTANTPHLVFDELVSRTSLPMVSIVETCAAEAARRGMKKLGLLGTRFTMEAPFYSEVFARRGMTVVSPEANDRLWVHDRYVGQLLKGDFRDETRAEILSLVEQLRGEHRLDGLILGGTELPLLLRSETIAGLPTLDTTALHVEAIVDRLANPPRRIVGFHQDDEQHWVADLECGHTQHVRHDPPWQNRPWVTSAEGRERFLGTTLPCRNCEWDETF